MFDFRFCCFILDLLASAFIFTHNLVWRRRGRLYGINVVLLLMLFTANTMFFNPMNDTGVKKTAYYAIIIVGFISLFYFAFQVTWMEAVVLGSASYTAQHCAYDLHMIFLSVFQIDMDAFTFTPMYYFFKAIELVTVYWLIYDLFLKNFQINSNKIRDDFRWLILSVVALFMDVVFNIFFIQIQAQETWLAFYSYDTVCTILILAILLYVSDNDSLRKELRLLRQIQQMKKEQYEMAKESIEQINIKCHDIKQQILQLCDREGKYISPDFVQELNRQIYIYDSIYKTGNTPLDVILTEKSLVCGSNDIRMACMADGQDMDFMSESDIYSLLGNIIDNAIESELKLKNREKREINLLIKRKGNLLHIQEQNYFEDEIRMEKGFPVTSKGDKENHGFGMKSIRMLVDKYHGELQITAEDQIFSIDILLPCQERKTTE